MSRRNWQELIGARPHMIEETAVEAGYTARDSYEIVNAIAVIDASGVLVNAAWDGWRTSTYGRIMGEVRGAAADPQVEGILLRVNSPGGETDNSFETADEIRRAAAAKPVWAVADVSAYSAGYLLAAAADRIYVAPKTGGIGSIGVYALHLDFSEALEMAGVRPTFIEDPKGKTAGHPFKPLDEDAAAKIRAEVQRLSGMFFDFVAQRRGLDVQKIRKMGARIFHGAEEALDSGLADRAGSIETALSEFRGYLDARKEIRLASRWAARANDFSTAASATVTSLNKEDGMSDHKADATPAPASQTTAPPAQRAAGVPAETHPAAPAPQEAAAPAASPEAEEIIALCAIAGLSAKHAHDFIAQKKSAKEVRAALIEARAAQADQTQTISQIRPNTGTAASKPDESPLVKAMTALAGKEA